MGQAGRRLLVGVVAGTVLVVSGCTGGTDAGTSADEPTASPTATESEVDEAEDPEFAALLEEHRQVEFDPGDEPMPVAAYAALFEEYEADLEPCGREVDADARTCERPDSLTDDLEEVVNVQILLDASGSMAGGATGGTKMQVARRVLTDFVGTLPENANVSVRLFGQVGSGSAADRARSCAGTEATDFAAAGSGEAADAIAGAEPAGWTPLARALQESRRDFARVGAEASSNFVYVVSDGIETCDGNPVRAARQLAAAGVGVEVNIVGFDVDREAAQQLRRAARAAGGQYVDASDTAELTDAFAGYDWLAWTQYYNCRWLGAQSEFNANWSVAYGNFNCIWSAMYREYNAVWGRTQREYNDLWQQAQREHNAIVAALNDRDADERERLRALAQERRDALIGAAQATKDLIQEVSRERRDTIVEAAREQRVDLVDEATARRDEIIEEARRAREAAGG